MNCYHSCYHNNPSNPGYPAPARPDGDQRNFTMTTNDKSTIRLRSAQSPPSAARRPSGGPAPTVDPPWIIPGKAAVPEPVPAYLHRPTLIERIDPTARRATVLKAPGGFGKTTLLAAACRGLRERGVLTAWLTLDMPDTPIVFEAYLAFAFKTAGLNVPGSSSARSDDDPLDSRLDILIHALVGHGGPCALFLDELERLADPATLELLDTLIKWSPPNLGLALACRDFPAPLDIGSSVLAGRMDLIEAGELRFTDLEATAFVGDRLPRPARTELINRCAGWPIALRILMNERRHGAEPNVNDVAGNWVDSRLWRGLEADSRELLLDLGLFERFDADLIDEVLCGTGLLRRIAALPAVAGLLESVRADGADTWRLHPLVCEHCATRRLRETPERYRSVNRRLAEALARRGDTVSAMRHAAAAEAPDLVAQILEATGAVRLWHREGIGRLHAADRYLTEEIRAKHPRLALAHCVVLMTAGRLEEARRAYRTVTDRQRQDRPGPGAISDFDIDDCTVRGMLYLYGCERLDDPGVKALHDDLRGYADMHDLSLETRGPFQLGLCIVGTLKAEFDAAQRAAARAEEALGQSPYVRMFAEVYRGQIAMAQGRVSDAARHYAHADRVARTGFVSDPGQVVFVEVLIRELDLERHRTARLERAPLGIPRALYAGGTPLGCFAAASATALELTRRRHGPDAAETTIEDMREYALRAGLPALVRYLAGLHVALLAAAGRVSYAERLWRLADLPKTDEACLDLQGQSWREMESLACARLRLLTTTGRHDDARALAAALLTVTAERGLCRTRMRALMLSVALERADGHSAEAEVHLAEFLHLYAETDYAGPAATDRETVLGMLERLLANRPSVATRTAGERLASLLRGPADTPSRVRLSDRELQIVDHLDTLKDREIAGLLGLTVSGVRYHVSRIFKKLGVNNRRMAVERAHAQQDGGPRHELT